MSPVPQPNKKVKRRLREIESMMKELFHERNMLTGVKNSKKKRILLVTTEIREKIIEELMENPDTSKSNRDHLKEKYRIELKAEQFRSVVRHCYERVLYRKKQKGIESAVALDPMDTDDVCIGDLTQNHPERQGIMTEINKVMRTLPTSKLSELLTLAHCFASQTDCIENNDALCLRLEQPSQVKALDLTSDDEDATVEEPMPKRPRRDEMSSRNETTSKTAGAKCIQEKNDDQSKRNSQRQSSSSPSQSESARNSRSSSCQEETNKMKDNYGVPKSLLENWNYLTQQEIDVVPQLGEMLHSQTVFLLIYQRVAEHNREHPDNKIGLIPINVCEEMERDKSDENLTTMLKENTYFGFEGSKVFIMPIVGVDHYSVLFFDVMKQKIIHANSTKECKHFPKSYIKKVAAILGVTSEEENYSNPSDEQPVGSNSCGVYTVFNCEMFLKKAQRDYRGRNMFGNEELKKRQEYYNRLLRAVENEQFQIFQE